MPSIDLIVTSPPYFNAPFDYEGSYESYDEYLSLIVRFGIFYYKALKNGAILALNIDDMLVKGIKYPIISDAIKILSNIGFLYKGRIVWKKPDGYTRISQRSGVLLQNPYPMYYYPDNLTESIIIFQKPFSTRCSKDEITISNDVWEMTNVLPRKGRLETNIAAFPEELPKRVIELLTKEDFIVCDPFLGSGTTMKVARALKRNSIGIELNEDIKPIILKKTGFTIENLKTFFPNSDEFLVGRVSFSKRNARELKIEHYSLFSQNLDFKYKQKNSYSLHLMIIDLRDFKSQLDFERLLDMSDYLLPGRIVIIYFDPIHCASKTLRIFDIFDGLFNRGLRFRDRLTIRHKSSARWDVLTHFGRRCIFEHLYYEVLIFQKGSFDYKSKSKEEKLECLIDKREFQKGRWFLSFWDFKDLTRDKCDSIVTSRLIELFLFNGEVILTNLSKIQCEKREFYITKIQ